MKEISIKEYFERQFDELKNNHLAHLEARMEKLEAKQDRLMWLALTTLTAVMVHAIGVILHG